MLQTHNGIFTFENNTLYLGNRILIIFISVYICMYTF